MQNMFDTTAASILIVDNDDVARRFLATLLKGSGHTVMESSSVSEGMTRLAEESVDLVLTELQVGEESGLDVVRTVRRLFPETETIIVSGTGTLESAVEAVQAGAFDFVSKPFTNKQILLRVEKGIERCRMQRELSLLRQHVAMGYGFDNIVGISKVMMQIKETARRIAPTDITVLITGPAGSGKELIARAIHHHSTRRGNPFVAIDCSAVPEAMLESELFGLPEGSVCASLRSRQGLVEEADGGTVFLDEVATMNLATQAKLLRFLQDAEVRTQGPGIARKVDVRILAATNRDLRALIARGEFREDLYYRLNVIPLVLPPLSERAEDIEILIAYFLRTIAAEMGGDTLSITHRAVEKIQGHCWPGNVRELENTLKRGAALCTNSQIDADDITFIAGERPAPEMVFTAHAGHNTLTIKGGLLDSGQRSLIMKSLTDNDWNFTKTAADLGIGRTTLWRKVKKYNLRRDSEEPVAV